MTHICVEAIRLLLKYCIYCTSAPSLQSTDSLINDDVCGFHPVLYANRIFLSKSRTLRRPVTDPSRWLPLALHQTKTRSQAVRSSKNNDRPRRPREIEVVTIANSSSTRRSWRQTVPSVCRFFAIPFKRPVVVIASVSPVLSASRLTKGHVRLVMK